MQVTSGWPWGYLARGKGQEGIPCRGNEEQMHRGVKVCPGLCWGREEAGEEARRVGWGSHNGLGCHSEEGGVSPAGCGQLSKVVKGDTTKAVF
jgi:hypothetical protein